MLKLFRALLICSGLLLSPLVSADQTSPKLDGLFDKLLDEGTSRTVAHDVISEIWQTWLDSDNPEAQKLMRNGIRMMNAFALDQAADTFTELIELEPEFAEAWNKRATVYYMMGRFDESTADVAETIRLEPRHFGALSGQGLIYLQTDKKEAALSWFKRALAVNPFMDNIRLSIEELEAEIGGKVI